MEKHLRDITEHELRSSMELNCFGVISFTSILFTTLCNMRGSRKFWLCGGGGTLHFFCCCLFQSSNVFHRGSYGPPSRSIWTQGVQLLLEGVPYQNSQGILLSLVIFRRVRPLPPPFTGSAHGESYRSMCHHSMRFISLLACFTSL